VVELIGQAVVMFAVTNVDDVVLLALFFGRARGDRSAERRVVLGQYAGFGAIIAVSALAAVGLSFLPEPVLAYLGLVPIAVGVKEGIESWRERRGADLDVEGEGPSPRRGLPAMSTTKVAGVTFANGGDNVGVYVPVFATSGIAGTVVYSVVFMVLVGVLCLAGRAIAGHPVVARALERWGHVLLPVVLVVLGVVILVEGGAFGL
jgi:cadmium resistance protein CadD (predicted permease)